MLHISHIDDLGIIQYLVKSLLQMAVDSKVHPLTVIFALYHGALKYFCTSFSKYSVAGPNQIDIFEN